MVGIVLLVLLVVLAVLFVVVPLLRTAPAGRSGRPRAPSRLRRIELRERRDAAYVALRELELDHETGKLDDRDYATATAELRAEALAALAALEDDDAGADPSRRWTRSAARSGKIAPMRIRPLLAAIGLLLARPRIRVVAAADETAGGTDHTTEIMFGLIIVLMVALVVIGIVEQRKPH